MVGETRKRVRRVLESLDAGSGVDIIVSVWGIQESFHEESTTNYY